ncbi:hypothetical protein GYMLUDRAFT_242311 [Collybiopsis luxurians FD-317 M1]|uniref:Protein HIRA-like C-terminal domain-containing protein n=1 Tax=Collybiopsis luxurians FD-317 M1 TaxID=944289 RepID=A0A0D0CIX5_9AGAR|nr:hypothetical protein GYMLUDRAFT_242311 [Collybiopsis luxurians FD-317 M1]
MVPIKEINDTRAWRGNVDSLPVPVTLTRVTEESEGSHVFEGLNPEDDKMEDLPVHVRVYFSTAATLDGSVNVYSLMGRRLIPGLNVGSPCSLMDGSKSCLLVITQAGMLNANENAAHFPPVSVTFFISTPNNTILSALTRPDGTPIINSANGTAYSSLYFWVKIGDRRWSDGSDVW